MGILSLVLGSYTSSIVYDTVAYDVKLAILHVFPVSCRSCIDKGDPIGRVIFYHRCGCNGEIVVSRLGNRKIRCLRAIVPVVEDELVGSILGYVEWVYLIYYIINFLGRDHGLTWPTTVELRCSVGIYTQSRPACLIVDIEIVGSLGNWSRNELKPNIVYGQTRSRCTVVTGTGRDGPTEIEVGTSLKTCFISPLTE